MVTPLSGVLGWLVVTYPVFLAVLFADTTVA
jgi:hypothetical protein